MNNVLFLFVVLSSSLLHAEILSAARVTTWMPGVPGGIPEASGPIENILQHGADPTGTADSRDALMGAIEALPTTGGVVYLPEGTYRLGSLISIGKNGVRLRGDGPEKTRLLCDHTDLCFDVITYKRGSWQNLLSDYSKGASTVIVEDGSRFVVGAFAEIQQENDSALMYTSTEWIQDWAQNSVGQLFEITLIEGNKLTFRSPIHFEIRSDQLPQIRPQGFVRNVGFENFYIERLQSGNSTFQFKNAAYCWIRNIESYHTRKSHVTNNTTLGCEYRDSYFHHSFSYGGGGSGYGVEFGFHATDGLCENNIFDSLRHAMMVHVGSVGCVFGYNYSIHPVQGEGESGLNAGWVPPDISLHGHYAQMNLFEGNVIQEIGVGDHWGPMGPGNTFLRNVIQGEGIYLMDHSHGQNFIGNRSTAWSDDGTSENTVRHGELINGTVHWDTAISDQIIPASLYLSTKPSFYRELEWPSVGYDKPEGKIPAQYRWESGNLFTRTAEKTSNSHPVYAREISIEQSGTSVILKRSSLVSGDIKVDLYNVNGRNIIRLPWSNLKEEIYSIDLKSIHLSSGVYLFVVRSENTEFVKKMPLRR